MASSRIIELAIKGLEAERAKIDQELESLRGQAGTRGPRAKSAKASGPAASSGAAASNNTKRKGGLSEEGRRRLSEMAKKRWAKSRKLGKTTL